MTIEPITFVLKDSRACLIRSPREEDIQGVLDYLYQSAKETEFVLRYPEECGMYTEEGERAYFEASNKSDNQAMLVALVDGQVVGTSQIAWSRMIKLRHRASVAIAILRDYWGQGLGTKMMEEMFRIAKDNPNLIQLELDYIEGNERALALYTKMGFVPCGVKSNAIRLKDGSLLKEYSMMKEIKR